MSRAFVKEPDGDVAENLPQRPISPHRNLVTEQGLKQMEAEIDRLRGAVAAADGRQGQETAKAGELARDLRYWLARRASAELVAAPRDSGEVRFGNKVTIERDDGRRQTYTIVGEDEAAPAKGLLSHTSPLAAALFGKRVGDPVSAGNTEAEIVSIE